MPEFKIKMPDGQIRTVSGPDREGAMAFAKANYRPTTAAPAVAAPAPAEADPEGVSLGRAFKRGLIQTYAGAPTALAMADIQKLQDASQLQKPAGVNALAYDELMKTRVPLEAMAGRSVNLDVNTLEGRRSVDALQDRYNVKPGEKVDYLLTLDKRMENAENVRSMSPEDLDAMIERTKTNAKYAGDLQDKASAIPKGVRGGIYADELARAPDTWKGWLSTVTNDPVGFVEFIGETTAESGAQIVAGLATSLLTRSPKAGALVMGSGGFAREYGNEVASFLEENGIDLSDKGAVLEMFQNPQLMDEANSRGVTRGVVIAAADFAGQGLVAREFFKKSLTRQVVAQMGTEGAGEALATQAVGDDFSVKDTVTEALAGGASAAPEALVAGNSLWQKRYNAENQEYQAAASDLARLLRSISDKEGLNLKDVTTQGAAKQTLEAAHEQISGQIKAIVGAPGVRERLSPKNAETLDQLLEDYAAATTAVRQGKNKVKSKVTDENGQAMARLLGPTQEAGQLLNLFAQGNVLTDLFADGTKGGVSQFTDFLNPLQNDGGGGFNVYRGLNVLGGVAGATQFGIPATVGIIAGGRAIDAVTGRRSKVNRFVKKLEKLTGQEAPQGPSLIAAAALERQQAEQAKTDDAAQKAAQAEQKAVQEAETANITATLAGITGNATDGSPLGTIAVGTGIDPQEIQTVISELRLKHPADSKKPEDVDINKVLDDAQAGLNGEQKPIRALTQLVNLVNNHLNADLLDGGSSVQRTSLPDQPLAQAQAIQRGNVPTMDAAPTQPQAPTAPSVMTQAPAQPTVNGNQTTTSENYQAGKQANQDFALNLQEQVMDTLDLAARQASNRPEGGPTVEMLDTEAEALYIALESVQTENMPIEVMEEVQQALLEEGVSQENVDKFYKPYVDRARRQQKNKPSMLAQAQATQQALSDQPISDDSRSIPEEGIYVDKPAPAADYSRTPDITPPQILQPTALGPKEILVEGQIKPEEQQGPRNTNHGLLPHLRVNAEGRKGKALILQGTDNKNAARQLVGLDEVLARHGDPAASPEAWSAYQGDALATSDVPVQPNGFINDLNNGGAQELLGKLTPGQIADADHGFENAAKFRQDYIDGKISIADTGRLFLWSFLSRGVSPYTQESLFLDSFDGIDPWIEAAADQTLGDKLPAYKEWAAATAPKGSGQPGAGAMHNLNAFGVDFLMKMSKPAGGNDPRSRLEVIHEMMSSPGMTGQEIRREFTKVGEGVGIDNKVVSFTLLVAGFNDVMVMDRVQVRQMYNDGRFDGINLYDGYKQKDPKDGKSKVVTGTGFATQTNGVKGLMIYEAMEKSLSQRLSKIYGDIGRPEAASVGRYHWETWVASSEQEASHGTINAILAKAQGDPNPLDGVTAKEGEYGSYAYGAKYGLENGQPMFKYEIPDRGEFKFTVPAFREFLDAIKKPKNKVVPSKFSVSKSGNAPWYTRDGVNLDALAEKATEYGNSVSRTDDGLRQDQAIPDGRQPNATSGSDNSIQPALLSPPGPTGGRAPRSDAVTGPATKGRTLARVALTAVKRFVPEAKVPFQVGRRGTKYENGIQTLDQALYLAQTLGITVRLFDSQAEAFASRYAIDKNAEIDAEASFYLKGPSDGGKGAEGTIFGLNPGALLDNGGRVSGIEALSNVIHEIAHGMTLGPLDLNGSQVNDTEFTNPVTGQTDRAPAGSFAGSALRPLLEGAGDPDIMSEIDNLQLNVDAYTTNDPAQRSALRGVRQLMDSLNDWKDYYQKEVDAGLMSEADAAAGMDRRQANMDYYTDYMQGVRELAVDPVLIYLINPKLAKAVMPKTAALIREQFNNAGNNKVKFYSHPMAVVIATVMAMLAQGMAEEEEEEQQMQMPPGALSPPPPGMGALTA